MKTNQIYLDLIILGGHLPVLLQTQRTLGQFFLKILRYWRIFQYAADQKWNFEVWWLKQYNFRNLYLCIHCVMCISTSEIMFVRTDHWWWGGRMLASAPILHHLLGRQRFLIFSQVQSLKTLPRSLTYISKMSPPAVQISWITSWASGKRKKPLTNPQPCSTFAR